MSKAALVYVITLQIFLIVRGGSEIKCKNPEAPKHGSVRVLEDPFSATVAAFSCEDGAELFGSAIIKCLETGLWTSEPPKCFRQCKVQFIRNGILKKKTEEQIRSVGDLVTHNEALILRCKEEFYPANGSVTSREDEVVCSDGTWSKSLKCLTTSCLDYPPPIENGLFMLKDRRHGTVMVYRCFHGFQKREFGNVVCSYGKWTGPRPVCKDTRCHTDQLNYSGLIKPERRFFETMERFEIVCERGHLKSSSEYIICYIGQWNIQKNPCVIDYTNCDRFTTSSDLEVSYTHDVRVGSIAKFLCPPSTALVGSSYSICRRGGTWSHPLPSCEAASCSIETLMTSLPEGFEDMRNGNAEFLPHGSVLELKCKDNVTLRGSSKATCESEGKWDFGNAQCVLSCELKKNLTSHLLIEPIQEYYRFGDSVVLSCPPGKKLSEDSERLICLGKTWSNAVPDCID